MHLGQYRIYKIYLQCICGVCVVIFLRQMCCLLYFNYDIVACADGYTIRDMAANLAISFIPL